MIENNLVINKNVANYREFYLFGDNIYAETSIGLLFVPYLYPNLSYCHHVLDKFLDQTGSSTCQSNFRGNIAPHPGHSTC